MERPATLTRAWVAAVIGLAALLPACTFEYAPPNERHAGSVPDIDTSLVLGALHAYYRAFSARDWTAFAEQFWPGATITTVWQPPGADGPRVTATTIPDFVAAAPQGPGSREIFEETMLDARIRKSDGLAQAWVRYRARFGDPGAVEEWEGVDAFTLMRHDGQWRIVALAFQSDGGGP